VSQALSVETANRISAVNVVSQALSVETANRTSADNALSVRIDTASNAVSIVSQALSVETANRISAVNVVSQALSVETANRISAVNVVSQALSVETAARIAADNTISNAVSVVSQALSVEIVNRTSADNALSVRIDTASNAVSIVSQALSLETANRISADNALSVRIDTASNAVSIVSQALSLETANRISADNALSNSVSVTYAPKASPTFSGTVTLGNVTVSANNTSNIGTVSTRHNTIFATTFTGTAATAQYADLAEMYIADQQYEYGTVVIVGGKYEITITSSSHDTRIAGVISQNPAYLMNSEAPGLPVALVGRVPCKVVGPISKGDLLVASELAGHAQSLEISLYTPGCIIGKALEDFNSGIGVIEILVGKV
jgi:hypothetical protein